MARRAKEVRELQASFAADLERSRLEREAEGKRLEEAYEVERAEAVARRKEEKAEEQRLFGARRRAEAARALTLTLTLTPTLILTLTLIRGGASPCGPRSADPRTEAHEGN